MAFDKKTWEDRISEYPNRRTINDGNTTTQVTVGRDEGVITQAGDAFSASNMNDLEDRIADAVDSKAEQADTYTKAEVDTAIANAVEAGVKTDNYADLDTVDKTIIGAINEVAQSGGGGGSTTNYNLLTNKPSINGHELKGDSDTASLNLDYGALINKPVIPDVSNYYDKAATDALLADKADISSLATVATSGSYDDLTDKPDIPDLDDYYTKNETDILLGDFAPVATTGDYDDLINKPALATVATTGDYDDLINKPILPTEVTDISSEFTTTKSSGNWSITSIGAYRSGNTVQISIGMKGNGNSVSAGSNGFEGTITAGALPVLSVKLIAYYNNCPIMMNIEPDGSITARVTATSVTVTSSGSLTLTGTYITND